MNKNLPLNPYIAGNPVTGSHFFGREDVFRAVMQMLRHQNENAIVLYGQRRIGKTSVVFELERRLTSEGKFTLVYLDLMDRAAKPLDEVLYEIAKYIAAKTGRTAPRRRKFDSAGVYFRQTFLPSAAKAAATGGLVLLLDEFDVLANPAPNQAGEAFFPYLRGWMADMKYVKFIFVIGRRPEELSLDTMATFKGVGAARVSLLERAMAEAVVRQSELNGSLRWKESAIEKVWEWAQGHPYFTQLLCSVVWENAYDANPDTAPLIDAAEVDAAIDKTLERGTNAFHWLWDGLPPAERVVMAAMAEAGDVVITPSQLVDILNRSGVRLIVRALELAPDNLAKWELFRPSNGGYRFNVPLLRLWVVSNQPLRRVKAELDRLDPAANSFYQVGQFFYDKGQRSQAEKQLREALRINLNHLKSRLLLGRILLEDARVAESVDILQQAYEYAPEEARADLINALLAWADIQPDLEKLATYERLLEIDPKQRLAKEQQRAIWMDRGKAAVRQNDQDGAWMAFKKAYEQDETAARAELINTLLALTDIQPDSEKLATYERILKFDPDHSIAQERRRAIWIAQGEEALKQDELEKALAAFWQADDPERVYQIEQLIRERKFEAQWKIVEEHKARENWEGALKICETLLTEYPDKGELLKGELEKAQNQAWLVQRYNEALGALQVGNAENAQRLLAEVIAKQPNFKGAAGHLLRATIGIDAFGLQQKLTEEQQGHLKAETKVVELQATLEAAKTNAKSLQTELEGVKQGRHDAETKIVELQATLAAAKTNAESLRTELEEAKQGRHEAKTNVVKLQTALETAKIEAESLRTALEEEKKKLKVLKWILSRIEQVIRGLLSLLHAFFAWIQSQLYSFFAWIRLKLENRGHQQGVWLASSVMWLPFFVAAALPWLITHAGVYAWQNGTVMTLVLMVWFLTGALGHREAFAEILNFLPQRLKSWKLPVVILVLVSAIVFFVVIVPTLAVPLASGIMSRNSSLVWLMLFILGIGMAAFVAWKVRDRVVMVVGFIALFGLLINVSFDADLAGLGFNPFVKARHTVAQAVRSQVLAKAGTNRLYLRAEYLKQALLKDDNATAAYYALTLCYHDSLDLFTTGRFRWHFGKTVYSKAVELACSGKGFESRNMAMFLRRLQDDRTLGWLYQEYARTENPRAKQLCLFVLDGFATDPDVRVKSRIKAWLGVEQFREPNPEVTEAMQQLFAKLKSKYTLAKGDTYSMLTMVDRMKQVLSKGDEDEVADYALALSNHDSLGLLTTRRHYSLLDDNFYTKAVSLLQTDDEFESKSMALFLRQLKDPRFLDLIYHEYSRADSAKTKQLCLFVLEGFAADSSEYVKRELKAWLGVERLKEQPFEIAESLEQAYSRLKLKNLLGSKDMPATVQMVLDQKLALLHNQKPKAAEYALVLSDHDSLGLFTSAGRYRTVLDDDFYAKAVTLLSSQNAFESRSMALFLRRLQDARSLNMIDRQYSRAKDPTAKLLCLFVLDGFAANTNDQVKSEVGAWLQEKLKWEQAPELIKALEQTRVKFPMPAPQMPPVVEEHPAAADTNSTAEPPAPDSTKSQ